MSKLISSRCSDFSNFIKYLDKILASLPLNDVNKSQQMSLKGCFEFNSIEKYFKHVDNSFANTKSIKTSEPAVLTKEM